MNGVSGGGTIRHDFLRQIDDEENFTSNEKPRKNILCFLFTTTTTTTTKKKEGNSTNDG